ncbi:MAG: UGSC family (seleno)protein, partial [Candidatus Binataceae bacterium]
TCSMHDSIWFEINGKPTVVIATDVFVDAAEVQSKALGLPEAPRIFVAHPIQDATDAEIRAKADAIVDKVIAALTN